MEEDYPRTLLELERRFSTEQACRKYLFDLRWPDGFRCPRCEAGKSCSGGPSLLTNLWIDSLRFAIVPRVRTSPSGSATATAVVSAWTSKPKNRNFSLMTGSLRLWLWTVVPKTNPA